MATPSLIQGAIIGLSIAAPVGPIGLLCIRRAITEGRAAGLASGLGAATADAVYGVIAVSGLTALTRVLLDFRTPIQLCGAVFLAVIGIGIIRTRPPVRSSESELPRSGLAGAYASTFGLTLANPATILSFIGIFAGVGFGSEQTQFGAAAWLVAGVFLGSALWWLLLSATASWLGTRLSNGRLRGINITAGSVLVLLACWKMIAPLKAALT